MSPAELAGGFAVPTVAGIEGGFRRRLDALPPDTRRLLQLAAAEPVGDPLVVWRAAERLGIDPEAATAAVDADLLDISARVRFRHPLVRSAAYGRPVWPSVTRCMRRSPTQPTPRPIPTGGHGTAHRPHSGPDQSVAEELERSAARAQARGGIAAAAAFLERAATLTPDPAERVRRLIAAAHAKRDAGALAAALQLLSVAEAGPLSPLARSEVEHLRGEVAFDQRRLADAARLLGSAARRLEPLDPALARATHLEALGAATWAADLDSPGALIAAAEPRAPPAPAP